MALFVYDREVYAEFQKAGRSPSDILYRDYVTVKYEDVAINTLSYSPSCLHSTNTITRSSSRLQPLSLRVYIYIHAYIIQPPIQRHCFFTVVCGRIRRVAVKQNAV